MFSQYVAEKKTWPLQPAHFRPIAIYLDIFFAYFLLGRLEHFLEAGQPEEQFRPGRRLEEHLVTATLMLDKTDAVGIPVWIISLDLSKAFDRVHWPALWRALVDEGIPDHLVWILQCIYLGQCGEAVRDRGQSRKFNITGGVRQTCVLRPRLFSAVSQWAMREWKAEVGNISFNLMDGGSNLLGLDALAKQLDRVRLFLNPEKRIVITNEPEPPQTIATTAGMILRGLPRDAGQKRLGSMLTSRGSKVQDVDLQYLFHDIFFFSHLFDCNSDEKGETDDSGLAKSSGHPPGHRPAVAGAHRRPGRPWPGAPVRSC